MTRPTHTDARDRHCPVYLDPDRVPDGYTVTEYRCAGARGHWYPHRIGAWNHTDDTHATIEWEDE